MVRLYDSYNITSSTTGKSFSVAFIWMVTRFHPQTQYVQPGCQRRFSCTPPHANFVSWISLRARENLRYHAYKGVVFAAKLKKGWLLEKIYNCLRLYSLDFLANIRSFLFFCFFLGCLRSQLSQRNIYFTVCELWLPTMPEWHIFWPDQ